MKIANCVGFTLLGALSVCLGCADGDTERLGVVQQALSPVFTDATAASGISGGNGSWAGVWADVDGDGDPDLFTLGHLQPALCGKNQYWENQGGTFVDKTVEKGLFEGDGADADDPECVGNPNGTEDGAAATPEGVPSCSDGVDNKVRIDTHGAVWADYDRDGDLDLLNVNESITGEPQLFHALWQNNGGTFEEVAEQAGILALDHITRGTASVDFDRDGWLDIFMVSWQAQLDGNAHPDFDANNLLFRNDGVNPGDMVFTDVAIAAGAGGPAGEPCDHPGEADNSCGSGICAACPATDPNCSESTCASKKRTATWFDYNNDGWPDLFVSPPCGLLKNNGNGTFTDVSEVAGFEADEECQGASISDYDNDGDLDLFSTRGFAEDVPDVLFRNNGNGTFSDVTAAAGINHSAISRGSSWGDYDNDGDEDLYVVVFTKPGVANKLYQNDGDGTFTDVTVEAEVEAKVEGHGCQLSAVVDCSNPPAGGKAAGGVDGSWVDYDVDGDLDLFITNGEANCRGPYVLLGNGGNSNHWMRLDLVGIDSNPDAIMARVRVKTATAERHYMYSGQQHFMAQSKLPLHFGLGSETSIENIVVTWPNGQSEQFDGLPVDQQHQLVEGTGTPVEGNNGDGGSDGSDNTVSSTGGDGTGGAPTGETVFTSVAEEAGLTGMNASWGMSWADYDNDGHLDLLTYSHLPEVTCSTTQIWHSNGDGTFTDVTLSTKVDTDIGEDSAAWAHPDVCSDCITGGGAACDKVDPEKPFPDANHPCEPCQTLIGKDPKLIDAHDHGDTHGAVWLDFDRDGFKDFFIVNGTTKRKDVPSLHFNKLWRNNGDGTFRNAATDWSTDINGHVVDDTGGLLGLDHRGRGGFAFDFDENGYADIFVTNFIRAGANFGNLLLLNDGSGVFEDIGESSGIVRNDLASRSSSWVDYDNDGLIDVLVMGEPASTNPEEPTPGGPCALFRNLGDGTFSNVTASAGIVEDFECMSSAWGDYDNDGFMDLYVTRDFAPQPPSLTDILYRNKGDGTFEDVTAAAEIVSAGPKRGVTWGDYDNDGCLDAYVVVLSHTATKNRLFRNNCDGTFTDVAKAAGATGQIPDGPDPDDLPDPRGNGACITFVDYDKDGHLDIAGTNGEGNGVGPYELLRNSGTSGRHWLEVELVGTVSEINGLGAKLAFQTGSKTQHRYQGGPHHFLSQSLIPVHVGLGNATVVDTLTVTWPSGLVQTLEDVVADQVITIVEGDDSSSDGGDGSGGSNADTGDGGSNADSGDGGSTADSGDGGSSGDEGTADGGDGGSNADSADGDGSGGGGSGGGGSGGNNADSGDGGSNADSADGDGSGGDGSGGSNADSGDGGSNADSGDGGSTADSGDGGSSGDEGAADGADGGSSDGDGGSSDGDGDGGTSSDGGSSADNGDGGNNADSADGGQGGTLGTGGVSGEGGEPNQNTGGEGARGGEPNNGGEGGEDGEASSGGGEPNQSDDSDGKVQGGACACRTVGAPAGVNYGLLLWPVLLWWRRRK